MRVFRETSAEITVPKTVVEAKTEISGDSDGLLEQLLDLEQRLADDLARKTETSKPQLQAQWRKEIERLNSQLSNLLLPDGASLSGLHGKMRARPAIRQFCVTLSRYSPSPFSLKAHSPHNFKNSQSWCCVERNINGSVPLEGTRMIRMIMNFRHKGIARFVSSWKNIRRYGETCPTITTQACRY